MKRKQVLALMMALAFTITSIPVNVNAQEVSSEAEATVVVEENESEATVEEVAEEEESEGSVQEVVEETTQNENERNTKKTDSAEEKVSASEESNFTYELNVEENGIVITGYEGEKQGDLVIPDEIDGYPVTEIGKGAFQHSSFEGELVFPESIVKINNDAFYDCEFSGELVFPKELQVIGKYAFAGCKGFTGDLIFPVNVNTIDDGAFAMSRCFTGHLQLPEKLIYLGKKAFYYSELQGDLIIPIGVEKINDSTFEGCEGFNGKLYISDNVKVIGELAFEGCSNFTGELVLPTNLTKIANSAFKGCSGFTGKLVIPSKMTEISRKTFKGCTGLQKVEFSNLIEEIADDAFKTENNSYLKLEVNCPEGTYAFDWAWSAGLTVNGRYNIGLREESKYYKGFEYKYTYDYEGKKKGVIIIGYQGDVEEDLIIPNAIAGEDVIEIGEYAFAKCGTFKGKLKLPNKLKKIGNHAFSDGTYGGFGFTGELIFPDTLEEIGSTAFAATGFTGDLKLPKNLKKLGESAFWHCQRLNGQLFIPDSLTSIKYQTFYSCDELVGNVTVPEGVQEIGEYAFSICKQITGLKLPNSLERIDAFAFGRTGITGDLIVPEGVQEIGEYAFAYCEELENVSLSENVKKIGNCAFSTEKLNGNVYSMAPMNILMYCIEESYAYSWALENGFKVSTEKLNVTYNINYVLDGGENNSENPTSYKETSNTIKMRDPVKSGYVFVGWYSDSNYKTKVTEIATGSTGDKTLYAKWKKTTYKITYKLNSGKNSSKNPATYTITTSTIKLKNPTRTGYTFGGWYTSSKYKTKITEIKKGSTGNKTVYAKWTPNKYTIAFKGNGSTSGKMSSMTSRKYGTSYKLTSNTFKKKGYTFVGWNTKANGKGKSYKNKASVKNLTSKNGGKVTLYAQWKKNK